MTDKKEYFNDDLNLKVSPKLSADLNTIFKTQHAVPPEVDRAVIDRAEQHFTGPEFGKTKQRRIRWSILWKVAAAAAVIIFAFRLDLTQKPEQRPEPMMKRMVFSKVSSEAPSFDIDNNGRVDILDAFTLARRIESASYTETQSDINNDGLINSDDVDEIAMAAVRLDKGVL